MAEFVEELHRPSDGEQQALSAALKKFPTLFGGGSGTSNVRPVRLELEEGAALQNARPFPVPQLLCRTAKKEVQWSDDNSVLEQNNNGEWAAPLFAQPKKTRDVRIPTDFRKVNNAAQRKPFPLLKMSESLQRLRGFWHATETDPSMGHCRIPLDEESQKLCAVVFLWGKCCCKWPPMGAKNSPDIFQTIAQDLSGDLECASSTLR